MKKRTVSSILMVALLAVALGGCSDLSGLLPSFEGDSTARLELMVPGTAVRNVFIHEITPKLVVTGDYLTAPPNRADISILSRDGKVLAALDPILGDLTDPDVLQGFALNPADLDLPSALYYMEYVLYLGSDEVYSERIPFFYAPNFPNAVTVSTYPSVLVAGGYGLLRAQILQGDFSTDYDPYLRWEKDGQVLAEGYLSEGANIIPVLAPASAGVFRAALSVYPFGPEEGESFRFAAPLTNTVEAVVDKTPPTGPNDLGPADDFYTLLHFNGTLSDSGAEFSAQYVPAEPVVPGIRNSVFGLEYNPSQYLVADEFVFPVDDDGKLYPASLHWTGVIDFLPVGQEISLFSSRSGDWSADLLVGEDGTLFYRGTDGVATSELASGPGTIVESETLSIVVSYYPAEDGLGVVVFKNGFVAATGVLPISTSISEGPGSTTVGGSFSGIIDEFGIRYRSGDLLGVLAGGVYIEAVQNEPEVEVEFALSFENGEPAAYRYDPLSTSVKPAPFQGSGGLNFSPGSVTLSQGAEILIDALPLRFPQSYMSVQFDQVSPASGIVVRASSSGSPEDSVEFLLSTAMESTSSAQIALVKTDGGLRIILGPEERTIEFAEDDSVFLEISNTSPQPFSLYSISVLATTGDSIGAFLASLDAE